MRLTLPDYQPGDRIPSTDYAALAKHGKESRGACMVVGCSNNSVDCETHDRYHVTSANAAYERCKGKAITYCWGRADAGDATANPQEVWSAFSDWFGRAAFNYELEKRGMMPSLQMAWELFINDEEI